MKPALVIPFPQARRGRFIARLAARITAVPTKTGEKLLIASLKQQAAAMSRKGIQPDRVKGECHTLECAIRAEMWRRVLLPDDVA
jgi:hypothetical protein